MNRDEMEREVQALGNRIKKVIDEARAEWIEQYGGISSFPMIETGAIARSVVVSFVEAYHRVHGKRPSFHHLVDVIASTPPVIMAEAATQYGVPFVAVEITELAAALAKAQAKAGVS